MPRARPAPTRAGQALRGHRRASAVPNPSVPLWSHDARPYIRRSRLHRRPRPHRRSAPSLATSVAVRGERIVAVGHDEVHDLIGPTTEVVDLGGRLLVPGFQDAHAHPVGAGVEMGQCDLTGATTPDDCAATIRAYADARPDAPWITGGGWSMETFPGGTPDRRLLDSLVPDRPAYLVNRDHHGAWANSRALETAGITRDTADPADGRIERDADGRPTGMLQEGPCAWSPTTSPPSPPRSSSPGCCAPRAVLHSFGITAWQDALLGDHASTADPAPAYRRAAERGLLTARVRGALWWDRDRGLDQLPELLSRREEFTLGTLNCHTVKIMQDGIAENHTAAMLAPTSPGAAAPRATRGSPSSPRRS